MSKITEKVKGKLKNAKETVSVSKDNVEETGYDSTKHYEANEPMSPSKIKEHEPTAVKREMTEKIIDDKETSSNPEAREKQEQGV